MSDENKNEVVAEPTLSDENRAYILGKINTINLDPVKGHFDNFNPVDLGSFIDRDAEIARALDKRTLTWQQFSSYKSEEFFDQYHKPKAGVAVGRTVWMAWLNNAVTRYFAMQEGDSK